MTHVRLRTEPNPPGSALIVVLQSFRAPRGTTNPYLHQLVSHLPPQVRWLPFSWRTALLGRYDVLHLHWPEVMLRGSDRFRTAVRQVMATLLVARLALTRTPVVRTVHNLSPHEPAGGYERLLTAALSRLTRVRIVINAVDAVDESAVGRRSTERILHGHYREWFANVEPTAPAPGLLLHVGLIRPYKNVEGLVSAFGDLDVDDARLRLVGSCDDTVLRELIVTAARRDSRISHDLKHVDDADLVREVMASQLVVLPYRHLHNSGAALLALSLLRPVLVPDGASARALAAEVGVGWVRTFEHPLTPQALAEALADTRDTAASCAPPDLSHREWPDAGRRHAAAYARAVAGRRRLGRTVAQSR